MEFTVEELRKLVNDPTLNPTDLVSPNSVGNLLVLRDGEYIGWIELRLSDRGFKPLPHSRN